MVCPNLEYQDLVLLAKTQLQHLQLEQQMLLQIQVPDNLVLRLMLQYQNHLQHQVHLVFLQD